MIGKLKGLIDMLASDHIIIDVAGVGYVVACSGKTLANLPAIGEATSLLIETHVREDSINLYGFKDSLERDWFRQLITVKGVGAKLALIILSFYSTSQISNILAAQDKAAFKAVSGVGPKLAERIITELKDKSVVGNELEISKNCTTLLENNLQQDAISALINLGYSRLDAYNVTNKLLIEKQDYSISELIRLSLKDMAK